MADEAPEQVPEAEQRDAAVPEEEPVEEVPEVAPVVKEQYRLELPRPVPSRRVRPHIALRRVRVHASVNTVAGLHRIPPGQLQAAA